MDVIATLRLPTWQCAQNLIGVAGQEDPTLLEGDVLQGSSFLRALIERKNNSTICQFYFLRLVLAYVFRRDKLAAEMYLKCVEYDLDTNLMARYTICICAFYGCLAALSMQRIDHTNDKWQKIIDTNISRMESGRYRRLGIVNVTCCFSGQSRWRIRGNKLGLLQRIRKP